MSSNSRVGLVATVLIGLLVLSGAVMAAEVILESETEVEAAVQSETDTEALETESEDGADAEADTQFDFGYDEANRYLVVSVEPTEPTEDEASECDLGTDAETGAELTYTDVDGEIQVTTEAEGCELHAIDVTGPAGQVNHGMFMKAFNEYLDSLDLEYGRGCLIRHLAHSDFGKGDQQIRAGTDTEFETTETGTVDFTTALANCEHGPDDEEDEDEIESESEGRGKGKGKGKGKPDRAPGPPPWAGKGR